MLDDTDQARLRIADRRYKYEGARVDDMRALGDTETTFWARVGRLLEDPAAEAWDAQLVRRLRRLAEARKRVRTRRQTLAR